MTQQYTVSGSLRHGVVVREATEDQPAKIRVDVYKDGETFESSDEKLVATLRLAGTLLTAEEYAAAAAGEGNVAPQQHLAATRAALEDENAALKAEIEAMRAASGSSKPVKASRDGE